MKLTLSLDLYVLFVINKLALDVVFVSSVPLPEYGYELQLCQRYCVLYAQATASSQELIGAGSAWTSGNYWCSIRLPVPMRSTPTLSNTTGSNYYSWQSGGVTSYSTTVIDPGYYGTAGLGQMIYKDAMSGLSSGWGLICSAYTNGAKILYTAEL